MHWMPIAISGSREWRKGKCLFEIMKNNIRETMAYVQYNTIFTWCTLIYKMKSSSSVLPSQ